MTMNEKVELTKEMKVLFLNCLRNGSIEKKDTEYFRDFLIEHKFIEQVTIKVEYIENPRKQNEKMLIE